MLLGNVQFGGIAVLAPMAGVGDRAFREICKGFGASVTYGELTSSKGISMKSDRSKSLLESGDEERPFAAQIFGDDPLLMANAAKMAESMNADIIDINMGCPAPKVLKSGGGSRLMQNPHLCGQIVKSVASAVDVPVTAKIRAGFDNFNINAVEVAKRLEDNGACAVTVHGRTREQMFSPPVNLDIIAEVKEALSIPVVGNGDIFTPDDAKKMLNYTKCDIIMIGRGALGNPYIFTEVNQYILNGKRVAPMPLKDRMNILISQAEKAISYKGERIAMKEMRKHASYYIKGIKNAAKYRKLCGSLNTLEDLKNLTDIICEGEE